MKRLVLAIALTFVIMNLATFLVYGTVSALTGLEPPGNGSPGQFVVSVFVVKTGLAIGFVSLFYVARAMWAARWVLYALIWWIIFAISEVGQAIGPDYSWLEAGAGMIAEAIYCSLAALAIARLLRGGASAQMRHRQQMPH